MQPERQISVALTAIAAALVAPQYAALSHHQTSIPGAGLVVGGVLGAAGIFLGSLMAIDHSARAARALGLGLWIVVALALTGALVLGFIHTPTLGLRVVLALAAVLPLLGPTVVVVRRDRL